MAGIGSHRNVSGKVPKSVSGDLGKLLFTLVIYVHSWNESDMVESCFLPVNYRENRIGFLLVGVVEVVGSNPASQIFRNPAILFESQGFFVKSCFCVFFS